MSVDNVGSDTGAARVLADKKRAIEQEEANLQMEQARAQRNRNKVLQEEREKTEKDIVEISKAASIQMDNTKKLNTDRIHALNENTQKNFEALAATTAEQIKGLDAQSLKDINDRRASTMEKLTFVTKQTEDPFYRLKSLNPVLTESATDFMVKVALPEHEAKNLFVSADGQSLKMSLARRFQENAKDAEADRVTRTNSYQSIVEQLNIPGAFDAKGIKRQYENGVVTINVPKAGLPKTAAKNPAVENYVAPGEKTETKA
ncbi:MAG: Hsp20/alpha crystallin family protein [Bacteriovoracia bacterium]